MFYFFSDAVITLSKGDLGEEKFILAYSPKSQPMGAGSQGLNSRQEPEAETTEETPALAPPLAFSQAYQQAHAQSTSYLTFSVQDHLPRNRELPIVGWASLYQ